MGLHIFRTLEIKVSNRTGKLIHVGAFLTHEFTRFGVLEAVVDFCSVKGSYGLHYETFPARREALEAMRFSALEPVRPQEPALRRPIFLSVLFFMRYSVLYQYFTIIQDG